MAGWSKAAAEAKRSLILATIPARPGACWYTMLGCRLAYYAGLCPDTWAGVLAMVATGLDDVDGRLVQGARRKGPVCQRDLAGVVPDSVPQATVQHLVKRLVRPGILNEDPSGRGRMYTVITQA